MGVFETNTGDNALFTEHFYLNMYDVRDKGPYLGSAFGFGGYSLKIPIEFC